MNEQMNELFEDDFTEEFDGTESFEEESAEEESTEANLIDKIKSEGLSTKVKAIGLAALCVGVLALKKIKKGKAAVEPEVAEEKTSSNEVTVKLVVENPTVQVETTE